MNKKIKKSLLLAMVIMLFTVCLAFGASAETITGECGKQGDNVTWSFDTETETLTIQGEGEMADYLPDLEDGAISITYTPWCSYNIKTVLICDGVTTVGACSFGSDACDDSNSSISKVALPDTLTDIGKSAFDGCSSLEVIEIPVNLETIGERAFKDCSSVESLNIPNSVETIGNFAFCGCSSMIRITLPSEIKSIEAGVFEDCYKLTEIEIPKSVETIGYSAFRMCGLESISIPEEVKEIGNAAFAQSSSLERITVDPNNKYYSSDDFGVLYNKDKTTLISYPIGNKRTEYKMPDSVKIIEELAFASCPYIKKIVFSNSLEVIKDIAFGECFSLQDPVFPKSLKRIETTAFMYCFSYKNIVLPENVDYIGMLALAVCPGLESVTVKGMSAQIDELALCPTNFFVDGISIEEFIERVVEAKICMDMGETEAFWKEIEQYIVYCNEIEYIGTIYCHPGSTAEAYAIENGIDYVTQHFYGEWISDFDNMLQYRICETCGHRDERPLTQEEIGDVEIITPDDPDHDFEVDEKEPGSDSFVLVQEVLGAGIENCNVLKVFDITYKNKDGVHVQPDGSVRVKLPLDWEKDGIYKVYRVNDDGTLTDMEAYREGSHMVFDADHFSLYVIVDESEQKPDDTPERDFFQKIFDWFRQLLDLLIALFK